MFRYNGSNLINSMVIPLTPEQKEIINEYYQIAALKNFTEEQAQRMQEILIIAQSDAIIDFFITEADHFIGHWLNIIDENQLKDQQAILSEYLETDYMDKYRIFVNH